MARNVREYVGVCNYSSGLQFYHLLYRLVVSNVIVIVVADCVFTSVLDTSGTRLNRIFRNQRERFRHPNCGCQRLVSCHYIHVDI